MTYEKNKKVKASYTYRGDYGGYHEAYDENLVLGLVSSWVTDRPDYGDNIAPSYFLGKFHGGACDSAEEVVSDYGGNLFVFFENALSAL